MAKLLGDNIVVDALSRRPINSELSAMEICAVSYPYFSWLDDLMRHVENDDWVICKTKEVLVAEVELQTKEVLAAFKKGNAAATEVFVHWQSHYKKDATWEEYYDLKRRFPD